MKYLKYTFPLFSLILLFTIGCGTTETFKELPQSRPNESVFKTTNGEVVIQVGNFLADDSERYFGGNLRSDDVLGVFMRISNNSPSRIIISEKDCRLFGKKDGKTVEIPRLNVLSVADNYTESYWWQLYVDRTMGVLLTPVLGLGLFIISDANELIDAARMNNANIYEYYLANDWNIRALGPGVSDRGVLLFDWDVAEEYQDNLYLAIDVHDAITDWHTVLPCKVKVVYEDGWLFRTYK